MQPSYRLPIDGRFGEQTSEPLAFDTGNGPVGAPQWTPRQPPPDGSDFSGAGLDRAA
jgi:hypothetical protein